MDYIALSQSHPDFYPGVSGSHKKHGCKASMEKITASILYRYTHKVLGLHDTVYKAFLLQKGVQWPWVD